MLGVVFKCLDYLHTTRGVSLVIQGGAKGAITLEDAKVFAKKVLDLYKRSVVV